MQSVLEDGDEDSESSIVWKLGHGNGTSNCFGMKQFAAYPSS